MPIHDWTKVDSGIFHDFHFAWAAEIRRALNGGLLPPDYYAMAEQWAGGKIADVLTLHGRDDKAGGATDTGSAPARPGGEGVAIAERPPRVWFHAKASGSGLFAKLARRIVIRHVTGDDVVAVIELVSPGNKSDQDATDQFVRKARGLIAGGAHLLVVDLFPPTPRDPDGIHDLIWGDRGDVAPQRPRGRNRTVVSYLAAAVPEAYVEPLAVGEPLPDMPIFLTPELYVPTPLERTYMAAWDTFPPRTKRLLTA